MPVNLDNLHGQISPMGDWRDLSQDELDTEDNIRYGFLAAAVATVALVILGIVLHGQQLISTKATIGMAVGGAVGTIGFLSLNLLYNHSGVIRRWSVLYSIKQDADLIRHATLKQLLHYCNNKDGGPQPLENDYRGRNLEVFVEKRAFTIDQVNFIRSIVDGFNAAYVEDNGNRMKEITDKWNTWRNEILN